MKDRESLQCLDITGADGARVLRMLFQMEMVNWEKIKRSIKSGEILKARNFGIATLRTFCERIGVECPNPPPASIAEVEKSVRRKIKLKQTEIKYLNSQLEYLRQHPDNNL